MGIKFPYKLKSFSLEIGGHIMAKTRTLGLVKI